MPNEYGGKSFFSERLTRKVPDTKEKTLTLLLAAAGVILIAAAILYFKAAAIAVAAAVAISEAYLIPSVMYKEYEYILTDNTLDIDMITAKRTRKRLKSMDIRGLSEGGKLKESIKGELLCPSEKSENLYYLKTSDGETVIIDPNDMMLRAFEYYMGRKFTR